VNGIDDSYLAEAEQRARRFSGAYHGTSGALAGDVLRLLGEVRRLKRREPVPLDRVRIVALAGSIGSGKSTVAEMLPALHIQWADPIYAALAAMLGVSVEWLHDRSNKDAVIEWLGVTPRHLLQTLGTEWGRDMIHPDLWVKLVERRIVRAAAAGYDTFAICGTRFPNEAALVRRYGGEVWWVDRGPVVVEASHRSERLLAAGDCDRVIHNTTTHDELRIAVKGAMTQYEERRDAGMVAGAAKAAPIDAATTSGA
jgi:hypothetical protein